MLYTTTTLLTSVRCRPSRVSVQRRCWHRFKFSTDLFGIIGQPDVKWRYLGYDYGRTGRDISVKMLGQVFKDFKAVNKIDPQLSWYWKKNSFVLFYSQCFEPACKIVHFILKWKEYMFTKSVCLYYLLKSCHLNCILSNYLLLRITENV